MAEDFTGAHELEGKGTDDMSGQLSARSAGEQYLQDDSTQQPDGPDMPLPGVVGGEGDSQLDPAEVAKRERRAERRKKEREKRMRREQRKRDKTGGGEGEKEKKKSKKKKRKKDKKNRRQKEEDDGEKQGEETKAEAPEGSTHAGSDMAPAVDEGASDGRPSDHEAKVDEPLITEHGAEVLTLEDDFDMHEVKNDDADVTDKKFADNILRRAEGVEEEEVDEGLEAGDEDMAWVPPSLYKAQANREKKLFERGIAPLWNTELKELGIMGAGVPLYFKMLKYLATAFLIMTVLSGPIWLFSIAGTGVDSVDASADSLGFSRITIANARTSANEALLVNASYDVTLFGTTVDGKAVSYSMMVSDLLVSCFFIGFIFFFRHKVDRVVQETDANNVTTGDYAVMLHNIPSDATAQEIRRHFDELFQLSDPDWNFEGHLFGWFGKKESRPPQDLEDSGDIQDGEFIMPEDPVDPCRPVADVSNTQDAQYLGGWVAEVAMAYQNGPSLRAYLSARELAHDLRSARATVKKFALDTPYEKGPNEKKRLKALQAVDRLQSRIEKLRRTCTYNTRNAVAAYVTFNHEESYLRCVEDYEGSGGFISRFFQPPPLRFRRIHAVTVKPAAEPSNVLWEHLDTPYLSRMLRLGFTAFLSFLLLLASFFVILYAQTNKESFSSVIPNQELCNVHLPAALYGQYLKPDFGIPKLVRDTTPGICSNARHNYIRFDINDTDPNTVFEPSFLKTFGLLNGTAGGATSFHGLHDWRAIDPATNLTVGSTFKCFDPCVAPGDNFQCQALSCYSPIWGEVDERFACPRGTTYGNYSVQALPNCYCLQELNSFVQEQGFTGWFTVWFNRSPLCEDFVREWGLAQVLPFLAPLFVVVINQLLKLVLTKLARFERHHSTNEENKAIAWKVFLFQFINTALVTLIVFARMPNDIVVPGQEVFQYFTGEFDDFTTKWYAVVGASLTLTMLFASLAMHPPNLIKKWVVLPLKQKLKAKKAVTQRELNLLYEGPAFEIEQKLPKILNALFVTMFYCGGMPILIPVAAFNFALTFWVDKWLMLRFHTRPPYQDEALVEMSVGLLPYALIMHLIISAWMYGNSEVLQSSNLNMGQLFDANAEPSLEIELWLNRTARWDDLGFTQKVARQNVFPLASLGALVLAVVLVARLAGNFVKAATLKVVRCLLCGYCLTKNAVNPDRNYVPPFTEVFERELDPRFEHELTDQEVVQGWILNTDTEGRQWVAKQWLHDGATGGINHYQGQKKRTWEVIRDNDLQTYEMTENEVYADFLITAKQAGGDDEFGLDDREDATTQITDYSDYGDESSV